MARDLVQQVRRVPEVPDVELDADRRCSRPRRSARPPRRAWRSNDQFSIPSRWNGSSASRTPALSASRASVAQPVDDDRAASPGSRSPGPVKQRTADGSNRASRCERAQSDVDPLAADRPGPGSSGSGRIDGTAGTAVAEPSPLAASCSSASSSGPSPSFSSQMPIPSNAGGRVRAQVVGEARGERAHLRDREQRQLLSPRHPEP